LRLPAVFENAHLWAPGYLKDRYMARREPRNGCDVWLLIADHYEPYWHGAGHHTALERVRRWRALWPQVAARHTDNAGRSPRYTFFYPQEDYHPDTISLLAEMAAAEIADVEVHIHHDGEGARNFVDRMGRFTEVLYCRHGLLREHAGKLAFGFIHGNWALDNARPDGRWCGLNNELSLLKELGCYADFTLPAAPNVSQTAMVNTIYWATDDPGRPKSHNRGMPLVPGGGIAGDLLMVPGPLGINLRGGRRWRPRLETGELASYDLPVPGRAASWLNLAPRIGNHIFIKLFAHGAQDAHAEALLKGGLDVCFEDLRAACDARGHRLYFVSAWEMWRAIHAVRKGSDPLAAVQKHSIKKASLR